MMEKVDKSKILSQEVQEVFESLPIGAICLNSNAYIVYLNPEAERILKNLEISRENLIGEEVKKIFLESASSFFEQYQKVKLTQKKIQWLEFYPSFQAWLDISILPTPKGMYVFFRDVSHEKRLAERLIDNESRLLTIIEGSSEVVLYLDEKGDILFANRRVQEVFGYGPVELTGRNAGILIAAEEKKTGVETVNALMETWINPFHWTRVELMGLHKTGKTLPITFSLVDLVENQKRILIAVIRDISD